MGKPQHEKAYEHDQASEALAKKGRTGSLAYEVSRLLERLDKPSTAGVIGFHPDTTLNHRVAATPTHLLSTPSSRSPVSSKPSFAAGDKVRHADGYRPTDIGTVTRTCPHRGVYVRWQFHSVTSLSYRADELELVKAKARPFIRGDRVSVTAKRSSWYAEFGYVSRVLTPEAAIIDVRLDGSTCARPFYLRDLRHAE